MATKTSTAASSPELANLSVGIASGDALSVRRFSVKERISTLFSVSLTVVSQDPDIDFEAAVGQPARFEIRGGAGEARVRSWTGVCSQLQQLIAEEQGLSTYSLELVPTLWLASQRRNHRMFQQMSEVDIALRLLSEWGIEPERKLTAKYKKRKVRVQYGESDFTFLCRMLEDAGVSFYFAERDGESVLVLCDAPQANEPREPRISFREHPTVADREHVTAVRVTRSVRPGSYTMRDHDYRRPPGYKLVGTAAVKGVEERLERYHYAPGAFLFESEGGDPTPHAEGYNEILFEDLAAREVVYEQAQRNRRRLVKNDEVITVGHDRQKLVKANEIETTNLDRTEVTGVDRTEITGAHRVITIGGDRDQLVKGSEQEQTLGSLRRSVGGSADVVVGGALRESVGARHVTVGGDARARVGGSSSLTVEGSRHDKVGVDLGLEVAGHIHVKAGASLVLEVGSDFTIKGPGGFIRINAEGLTMKGSVVKINSGGAPGKGIEILPELPAAARRADVEEPARPEMDDVSRSRLGQ